MSDFWHRVFTAEDRRRWNEIAAKAVPQPPSLWHYDAQTRLEEVEGLAAGLLAREALAERLDAPKLTRRYRGRYRRRCLHCGGTFYGKRPWARYCGTNCRVLAWYHRRRRALAAAVREIASAGRPLRAAIERCLAHHHSVAWLALRRMGLARRHARIILDALRL